MLAPCARFQPVKVSLPACRRTKTLVRNPTRFKLPDRAVQAYARRLVCTSTSPYGATSNYGVRKPTPHSGYHFDGSDRRFFEGWYFKVTLPGDGQSFALIYSAEDPSGKGQFSGLGAQVMGPDDSYMLQYHKDVEPFWASSDSLALGACFKANPGVFTVPKQVLTEAQFSNLVEEGYQATTNWHQGSLTAREAGAAGDLPSTVSSCRWAFSVRTVDGWGNRDAPQKATAGWLAALPVFEPHWQVMIACGEATGWIEWDGKRYDLNATPMYAEKNWGGGFPKRWFWIECNTFKEDASVSVTAVGATRGIMNLPGVEEDVGMIGIHWHGKFIELVPWTGEVAWEVEPWGSWHVRAVNAEYEAVLEASCANPGTPLRAPTADQGLAPFCRDSFYGHVRLRLYPRTRTKPTSNGTPNGALAPLLDVTSTSGAVEVGGGPWWTTWRTSAAMAGPVKLALNLPVDVEALALFTDVIAGIRPPGL